MPATNGIEQPHMRVVPDSSSENRQDEVQPVVISSYFRWKPILDFALGSVLLLIALPVICVLAILVRLTSRGPGIYCQMRIGKNDDIFRLYKLRTMRCDAKTESRSVWTQEDDPRITPIGKVLREMHLDELPQLFNVVKGQMSLVGPRPEQPEIVDRLSKEIPSYPSRHGITPGITGLAQINLPPDSDLNSVRRKLVLDLEYCATAHFILDVRMLICTFFRLLGLPGTAAMKLIGLHRTVVLPEEEIASASGKAVSDHPVVSLRIVGVATNDNGSMNGNGKPHYNGKAVSSHQPKPR